jgi:hypothetical protein
VAREQLYLVESRPRNRVKRHGISKHAAYQQLLSTPEGLRLLADLKMVQRRYEEEDQLRSAAQRLEEVGKAAPDTRSG